MVSEQNSKFAPAGFGLGGFGAELNSSHDLNTLTGSGFFCWGSNTPVNAPFTYAVMLQIHRATGAVFQKVFQLGTSTNKQSSVERVVNDYVGEWEWNNPPMEFGVEYRTTERWNGKPVYTKLVDCGAAPNTASKSTYITDTSATSLVGWRGYASYSGVPLPTALPGWESNVAWDSEGFMFSLTTDRDRSKCNVTVQSWYVKG